MEQISLTERLADFALDTGYTAIPPLSLIKARNAVIDFLGCVMGAEHTPEAAIINNFVLKEASSSEATLVGNWSKISAIDAAMVNAYKCHILEYDDGVCGVHTGATVLPAAFAIAEKVGASGKELLRAVVLGIETAGRISNAAGVAQNKYWHSTGTCGIFGAAMASGILLGLNKEQIVWSLGNAGTMSAGLWEFNRNGDMSKYLHCAKAAHDGILASELAGFGLTGARTILEGEKGFFVSHSNTYNPEKSFETLGKEFLIDRLAVKPFPSCSHTHAAIIAALQIRENNSLDPDKITKITVTTYKEAISTARHNKVVSNLREARLSIAFGVAAALLNGKVDLHTFSEEKVGDRKIIGLIHRTEILPDDEMTKNYPKQWAAAVEVQTPQKTYSAVVKEPWGDLRNVISDQKLCAKFNESAQETLGIDCAGELFSRCIEIEKTTCVRTLLEGIGK